MDEAGWIVFILLAGCFLDYLIALFPFLSHPLVAFMTVPGGGLGIEAGVFEHDQLKGRLEAKKNTHVARGH